MKKYLATNLRVLKRSRKEPQAGDIFVMQLLDAKYLFGRVIRTNATIVSMKGVILIYVYNKRQDSKTPPLDLLPSKLLIAPKLINRLPWVRGYCETVGNDPLTTENVLPIHCFESPAIMDPGRKYYFDEFGRELRKRHEPCGIHALGSIRTLDDEISEALGIPLAHD